MRTTKLLLLVVAWTVAACTNDYASLRFVAPYSSDAGAAGTAASSGGDAGSASGGAGAGG